jgi:hypothetical protein
MKKLLFTIHKKDFKIQTFRSGGKGGQHQNKTNSGVRIIHLASGAVGESRSDRSQHRNKRLALGGLIKSDKFKIWIQKTVFEMTTVKSIDQRVEEAMQPKNIKIETKNESGRWVETSL